MKTQDEVMYALHKSQKYGFTLKEIAYLFGCDVATVRRHIDKIRWEKWEIVISPKKLQEVYDQQGSVRKTADTLMCSVGTVCKNLKKYNIKRHNRGREIKCSR
jgi:DNA invertase Pin-like site-specific DNA recombinase